MDMLERCQRQFSQRSLSHFRKDRVTKLRERDGGNAGDAIGDDQCDRRKQPDWRRCRIRQSINRPHVQDRCANSGKFCRNQRHHGDNDANTRAGIAPGPEVRRDPFDHANIGRAA